MFAPVDNVVSSTNIVGVDFLTANGRSLTYTPNSNAEVDWPWAMPRVVFFIFDLPQLVSTY